MLVVQQDIITTVHNTVMQNVNIRVWKRLHIKKQYAKYFTMMKKMLMKNVNMLNSLRQLANQINTNVQLVVIQVQYKLVESVKLDVTLML